MRISTHASRKTTGLGVLTLAAALSITACSSSSGSSSGSNAPYKVGAVLSLTGAYSGTDQDASASLKATVAQINDKGGINGHKLEYKALDSQSNAAKGQLAAQQIVGSYKPNFMFADDLCIISLGALTYPNNAGMVSFTGCDNGTPSNPSKYPHNFSTFPPSSSVQSPALVAAAASVMGAKSMSIGFLHSNDAAGQGVVDPLKAATLANHSKWAGEQAFAVGAPDLTVQMAKLRDAGANVVVLFGQVGDGATAMKALDQLKWNVQVIGSTSTVSTALRASIPPDLINNFHALVTAGSVRPAGGQATNADPLAQEFITNYLPKASNHVQTLAVVAAVHDSLMLWKWAVEQAKSTDTAAVTAQLEKLQGLPQSSWPAGLIITGNPAYSAQQHGEKNADLSKAWGLVTASENIMGTYEGGYFTCAACKGIS